MSRSSWFLACGALISACSALVDPDDSRLQRTGPDGGGSVDLGAATDLGVAIDAPLVADGGEDASRLDAIADVIDPDVSEVETADVTAVDAPPTRCGTSCDDRVECTVDSCDEASGMCAHRADNTVCGERQVCDPTMDCVRVECTAEADCQDETLCNGRERCQANHCVPGTPVRCDDEVDCTVDRCDPSTGMCSNTADTARCDDGAFCNGAETCDPARGCRPGRAPDCDDHVSCTTDRCDDASRSCLHTPNPSECPAPGPCVTSACDVVMGCRNTPVAGYCDSFCASGATCNVGTGRCSGGGTPRDCSDSDPCTSDLCDPGASVCRSTPIDADGDGFLAARVGGATCARGDDCNDGDPAIHRGATERCNGVDDDCDGATDEDGVCIAPGEDCAHAIALNLTGTTTTLSRSGSTMGRSSDFTSSCAGSGPDLVYAVTIPGDADLRVEAAPMGGEGDPVVSIRDVCTGPEVGCNGDATQRARDARVFLRGRSSSTTTRVVYVVVDDAGTRGGPFTLQVSRSAPIAPGNCGARTLFDVSAGGTVIGRTTTGLGSHSGTCGGAFLGEDVLLFNAAVRTSVNLLLVTANQVAYVRQRQCAGLQTNQLACFTGSQRVTVEAGSTWIMVDASRDSGEGHYILRVQP